MSMDEQGVEVQTPVHSAKVSRRETGRLRIESVPPEEFFVDRNCRTLEDAHVIAPHRNASGDLIAMGFDPEIVLDLDSFDEAQK